MATGRREPAAGPQPRGRAVHAVALSWDVFARPIAERLPRGRFDVIVTGDVGNGKRHARLDQAYGWTKASHNHKPEARTMDQEHEAMNEARS